jgi:hypothetical protein
MSTPSTTHVLIISPTPRKSGGTIPGKFGARLGDRLIVEASRTPFCDGARVLLAEGLAAPNDLLVMRHAGGSCDAVKAAVGVAAGLTVDEESTPRFRKWQPHPIYNGYRTVQGDAPMRENDRPVPDLPSGLDGPVGLPGPVIPPPLAMTGPTGPAMA